ncbi:MAG: hypothetical protein RJB11_1668, partial [Planctomycetota bacterium]
MNRLVALASFIAAIFFVGRIDAQETS